MEQIRQPPDTERGARARLMAAAVESFAAKGFHGTTTRDIASGAGMSPAALYVHHRSKEDLLYEISRAGHERTLALVREAVGTSRDPREQLLAVVHAFVVHHAEDHTGARIVNYELAALSPEHLEEIAAIRRQIEQEMRDVVERGVAAGVFATPDAHMTALALLSLGIDVARWYRDEGDWSPEQIADHYSDLALRIVGAVPGGNTGR
ncbi:MAG TPA: TetR/AcrR family transcriptional regulator [Nocardioidaceae bacterium]|nr:TetR/AcrR family transcriptional regulator [Nocardioidaceae bacterium]